MKNKRDKREEIQPTLLCAIVCLSSPICDVGNIISQTADICDHTDKIHPNSHQFSSCTVCECLCDSIYCKELCAPSMVEYFIDIIYDHVLWQ